MTLKISLAAQCSKIEESSTEPRNQSRGSDHRGTHATHSKGSVQHINKITASTKRGEVSKREISVKPRTRGHNKLEK